MTFTLRLLNPSWFVNNYIMGIRRLDFKLAQFSDLPAEHYKSFHQAGEVVEMLTKDSLREKLFRNQVGGAYWTVPELSFEKQGLIPAVRHLVIPRQTLGAQNVITF